MRISDCGLARTVVCLICIPQLLLLVSFDLVREPRDELQLHSLVIAEACEPFDVRLATKPCQLSFGIMAHVELRLFERAFERALAAQMFNHAPVSVRAERVRPSRRTGREQTPYLCDQPGLEMCFGAHIDASVEFRARRVEWVDVQARDSGRWCRARWLLRW